MGLFNSERMSGIAALIAARKARADKIANEYIQKICRNLLSDAAVASPQWSGDYASNWSIVTDSTPMYNSQLKVNPWQALYGEEFKRGDPHAIDIAESRSLNTISKIHWRMPVYLVNATPIADSLDNNEVELRPVNRLTPDMTVVSYLKTKYRCVQ